MHCGCIAAVPCSAARSALLNSPCRVELTFALLHRVGLGYRWESAGVREPTERICLHCPATLQSIHRVSLIDSPVESL